MRGINACPGLHAGTWRKRVGSTRPLRTWWGSYSDLDRNEFDVSYRNTLWSWMKRAFFASDRKMCTVSSWLNQRLCGGGGGSKWEAERSRGRRHRYIEGQRRKRGGHLVMTVKLWRLRSSDVWINAFWHSPSRFRVFSSMFIDVILVNQCSFLETTQNNESMRP